MSCPVCIGHSGVHCPCCGAGLSMRDCPDCDGTGKTPYLAWNPLSYEEVKVSEAEWRMLPEESEDTLCRCEEGGHVCRTCQGKGVIPEEF